MFYRILDNDFCRYKSQWYCARLRCLEHKASLIDIEDQTEFEWLKEMIDNNSLTIFQSKQQFLEVYKVYILDYYIDLNRYLYNPRNWTWGGPTKQRSFSVNLSLDVHPIECEQELCAAIRYTVDRESGSKNFSIRSIKCVGERIYQLTICKKRVQIEPTGSTCTGSINLFTQPVQSTSSNILFESNNKILLLVTLILAFLLALAVITQFLCGVCLLRRRHVPPSASKYDYAVSYRIEQREPYATITNGIVSDMCEAPAPAAASSPELNTYEMVE